MANIFLLEKIDDFTEKINIDELYEKKRNYDLAQKKLFNKILNRIHVRIKTTSRQKMDENFCWFVVPEIIIGVPKFDQANCIAYLMDKLTTNGFQVKYTHPNTLLILWSNWVPSYVRDEIKIKTGIKINEFGIKQEEKNVDVLDNYNSKKDILKQPAKKNYTPIHSYKPSNMI